MGFRHTFPELFIIFKSWANIQSKGPVREGEQVVLWAEFNAANSKPKFDPKGSTLGILAPLSFRGFSLGMAPVEDVSKVPLGPENQIFQFDARAAISTKDFELVENRKKIDQEQGSFGEVSKIPESTEKLEAKFRSRYPNDDQRPFWGFDHLLDVRNEYGVPLAMKRYDEGWSVFNDHMGFASGVSLMEALGQRLAEEGMSVRHKNLSPGYFGHFRWVSAEKVNFNNIVIPGDTVITDIGELSVEEVDSAAGTFDVVTPRATMYLPRSKETVGQFAKERSVLDLLNLRLRLWMPPA
jgi:hypothetical protein